MSQADLLRCIIGNPFRPRPALPPDLLAWQDATIFRLAQAAYNERPLPAGHLDVHRLAVLSDALEEAGLPLDNELLLHLRRPGSHVRGCFAVDAILGLE
jgi:hypothetical protein